MIPADDPDDERLLDYRHLTDAAARRSIESAHGIFMSRGRSPWSEPLPVDTLVDGARSIVVVEAVNDNENIGSIFRNAAAFDIDAVLLDADGLSPHARR